MRFFRITVPRLLCAGTLLVAATLKSYQLLTDHALGTRLWQFALIEFEVLLAAWLLSGVLPVYCRRVVFSAFAVYACYALYLGITGAESCGCFGRAKLSPWWTCGIDGVMLQLLWRWIPSARHARLGHLLGVGMAPAIVGTVLIAITAAQPRTASADGIVFADNFVVLEPEKWLGKPFPLFEHLESPDGLRQGRWKLLFYHNDCPKCRASLQSYEATAARVDRTLDDVKIALVEVPPYTSETCHKSSERMTYLRLKDEYEWFLTTPCEITLQNGRVLGIVLD